MIKPLILLLFLSGCGWFEPELDDLDCRFTMAMEILRQGEVYQECNKADLIQDFKDYSDYIHELRAAGELHNEAVPPYHIPQALQETSRVFCNSGCYAPSWLYGQCFTWETAQRKTLQRIEHRASLEPAGCKERYEGINNPHDNPSSNNWKQGWKYRNWKTGKYKRLGDKIWKPLKQ